MALFKSTAEIKTFVAIDKDTVFQGLLPYIEDAESQYIIPLIGQQLYDRIDTAYNASDPLSNENAQLLKQIQRPLINIALWIYAPICNLHIGDNGFVVTSTQDTKPAFEWMVDKALVSLSNAGMNGLEGLLTFLEKNLDKFPEYKDSAERNTNNAGLIKTGIEFSHYYFINRSRLTFITLRSLLQEIEFRHIAPVLGEKYAVLLQAEDLSAEDQLIAKTACYALAYRTIAEAIPQLACEISPAGLSVNYVSASNNLHYKSGASSDRIDTALKAALEKADTYKNELIALVTPAEEPTDGYKLDNKDKKIYFF